MVIRQEGLMYALKGNQITFRILFHSIFDRIPRPHGFFFFFDDRLEDFIFVIVTGDGLRPCRGDRNSFFHFFNAFAVGIEKRRRGGGGKGRKDVKGCDLIKDAGE